jgi:hypothetical protein
VDGATTYDIAAQIHRIPPDASHLVLSVGGNDALQSGVLHAPVNSMAQALRTLADVSASFERAYRAAEPLTPPVRDESARAFEDG